MDTKVTTVIVNATKQGLTLKVGNRNCYAKLTSVKVGGHHRMQLDLNWTYQEFLLHDKSDADKRLFLSSDDCCDCDRITITKNSDGQLELQKRLRHQYRSTDDASVFAMSSWKAWLCKFFTAEILKSKVEF